jgi:hypothetical protein
MATARDQLPDEIVQALDRLRRLIRQYVVWQGVALVVIVGGALFWGSFLLDWGVFALSKWELPRWLRATVLIVGVALLIVAVFSGLIWRLARSIRAQAIALVLERRFPQLGDRLITAVQWAEAPESIESPQQQALLQHTVRQAAQTVAALDVRNVFDFGPLRRGVTTAVVLISSILGLAVVDSDAMERWWSGFVKLEDSYWTRATQLEVTVLTQPGDRIRRFENRRYLHPRGADLVLQVRQPAGQIPDRILLDYRLGSARSRRIALRPDSQGVCQYALPGLLEEVSVWVSGGDFAMAQPNLVDVVDPPRVDQFRLHVLYPDYTGWNISASEAGPAARTELPVEGASIRLPLGTDVRVTGVTNKPLRSVRWDFEAGNDRFTLEYGRATTPSGPTAALASSAERAGLPDQPAAEASSQAKQSAAPPAQWQGWLTLRTRDGQTELRVPWPSALEAGSATTSEDASLIASDGRQFVFPLMLMSVSEAKLAELITQAAAGTPLPHPLPWPADVMIRCTLEDDDGISSSEPTRLTLEGQVDELPAIDVQLRGISQVITRQARVPMAGVLRDDFGIATARFEYQLNQQPEWNSQTLQNPPKGRPLEFSLQRAESEPFERFDVLPLDLSVGDRLTLTLVAADANPMADRPVQRSPPFTLQVVTVEELLSQLYAKEINLRKRCEQIVSELQAGLKELQQIQTSLKSSPDSRPPEWLATAERSLLTIRKSSTETEAVAAAFREIREELVNNAAETPQNLDRLDAKILGPLDRLIDTHYPAADASAGLWQLALARGQSVQEQTDAIEQEWRTILERLERVLLEMKKLETVHEALELLKSIRSDQDGLYQDTKSRRKAKAIEALELP